jgi:hypothetical protein
MKLLAFLLLASAAWSQAPLKAAAVNPPARPNSLREVFKDLEARLDGKLRMVGDRDPVMVLGFSRGIYLPGFGTVFTAEVSLVATPVISPFQQTITDQEKARVLVRKVAQVPVLKKAMREMWLDLASGLTSIPQDEQIVLAIRVLYQPWEDTSNLPGQIVVRGPRKAALTGNVQVEEQ